MAADDLWKYFPDLSSDAGEYTIWAELISRHAANIGRTAAESLLTVRELKNLTATDRDIGRLAVRLDSTAFDMISDRHAALRFACAKATPWLRIIAEIASDTKALPAEWVDLAELTYATVTSLRGLLDAPTTVNSATVALVREILAFFDIDKSRAAISAVLQGRRGRRARRRKDRIGG